MVDMAINKDIDKLKGDIVIIIFNHLLNFRK